MVILKYMTISVFIRCYLYRLGKNIHISGVFLALSMLFNQPVTADIDNLRLQRLSPIEGLSQGSVTSLLLDSNGFLWLATDGGLNFYDGYEVKQLNGPNNIFADATISYLYQDSSGLIWISTLYSGLYSLNPITLEYHKILDTKLENKPEEVIEVIDIEEDKQGYLWLAVTRDLMRYDQQSGEMKTVFSLKELVTEDHIIRRLLIDDNIIYIATSAGLYVLETDEFKWRKLPYLTIKKPSIDQINAKSLFLDEQATLWVGTVEGLYSVSVNNIDEFLTKDIPPPAPRVWEAFRNIWKILPGESGFYIATDDGLYNLQPESEKFERIWQFSQSQYQISDNNIRDMLLDKHGNLWLASRASGAYYWVPKTTRFSNIHQASGKSALSNDTVWSVVATEKDILWVGTDNGMNRVDLKANKTDAFMINQDKKAIGAFSSIYQIIQRSESQLWLVTGTGLTLFDIQQKKAIPYFIAGQKNQAPLDKLTWGYQQDNSGRLWFINDDGFYRYDPQTGQVKEIEGIKQSLNPSLTNAFLGFYTGKQPQSMLISVSGQLWLFNEPSGELNLIYQITPNQPQTFVTPDNWVVDKDNTLWLTVSGHGLIGLDADNFTEKYRYNLTNSLPTNSIYGAQLDEKGDLWLSSHAGILHMNTATGHLTQFNHHDGLAANEFNGGAHTKLVDGRLVYGSMKGVSIFKPELLSEEVSENYSISITGVSLLSRQLGPTASNISGNRILLQHDDIGLKINYSTLSFEKQNETYYRVKLNGKDSIEIPNSRENYVIFPQLIPGDYTFSVIAINPKTGKESAPVYLDIRVNYAPFTSPLAYSTYALIIIVSFLYWLYRRRVRQYVLLKAHRGIAESEKRLKLALKGSGSGEWDWWTDSKQFYEPRIYENLGYRNLPERLSFSQHLELIHPDDKETFNQLWNNFVSRLNVNFECTYRLKTATGDWQWYRDLGRVVFRDSEGTPKRIAGIYTNITNTRANEEKAKLFGEAFKQTRDWVVILDSKKRPIAANKSFYEAFGIKESSLFSTFIRTLGIDRNKLRFYQHILDTLKANEHWSGEELVVTKQGRKYPSLIKISANTSYSGNDNCSELKTKPKNSNSIDSYVVILTDISEQKKAEQKLRVLANYDGLTGLPNRNLLAERIQHAIKHIDRIGSHMALFFIDLDRFKQINDSLGHDVGDLVLYQVARRLERVLRVDDTIARFGGDEFIVLLESYNHLDDVSHVAQKIIDEVNLPIEVKSNQIRISPSVGIALYPNDAANSSDLLKHADVAMYHAKESGGNDLYFYDESMNELARYRLSLENKIKRACQYSEFVNYYQPIINVEQGTVAGFELLLRWKLNDSIISPTEFIPVAEEIGLIISMTEALLERGLADLKKWWTDGNTPYLSVNLSARHLLQESLVEDVISALAKSELPASSLRFEITESSLMKDHKKSIEIMNNLNSIGIELALDDFGTGYSSLQYLKSFPINIIKIDRSFVKDIGIDGNDEAIIDAILMMAKSLNKYCIAEGVETQEQLDFLKQRGCYLIQGFLFSKPLKSERILEYISNQSVETTSENDKDS